MLKIVLFPIIGSTDFFSKRCRRSVRLLLPKGVDDNDSGRADFADAKLADDAGDVAAAAVARFIHHLHHCLRLPTAGCRSPLVCLGPAQSFWPDFTGIPVRTRVPVL